MHTTFYFLCCRHWPQLGARQLKRSCYCRRPRCRYRFSWGVFLSLLFLGQCGSTSISPSAAPRDRPTHKKGASQPLSQRTSSNIWTTWAIGYRRAHGGISHSRRLLFFKLDRSRRERANFIPSIYLPGFCQLAIGRFNSNRKTGGGGKISTVPGTRPGAGGLFSVSCVRFKPMVRLQGSMKAKETQQ